MVTIPNIDGKMWDLELKVAEIIKEYQLTSQVLINLNNEGPDANELGLYNLLDYLSNQFNFVKNNITIITNNVLEKHHEYKIIKRPPLYVDSGQKFAKKLGKQKKHIQKHFAIFISRSNWSRLLLSSDLYNNYKDKTVQTFHYDHSSDYHKNNLGLEDLLHRKGTTNIVHVKDLILNSPIKNEITNYPIITPEHFNISTIYPNFFVEIVCETYCLGKTFYPTEKIWRPLICRTPFIVQGPVNFLSNLKKLGFQTFSDYWDESYDEDGFYGIKTIKKNIERLSNLSIAELTKMYNSMQPILDNNFNVFMSMTDKSWNIFND